MNSTFFNIPSSTSTLPSYSYPGCSMEWNAKSQIPSYLSSNEYIRPESIRPFSNRFNPLDVALECLERRVDPTLLCPTSTSFAHPSLTCSMASEYPLMNEFSRFGWKPCPTSVCASPSVSRNWELENTLGYPSQFTCNKALLMEVAHDRLKNLKSHAVIDETLDLLRGPRQSDYIWKSLESGMNVPPRVVSRAIQTDRVVDAKVADLIQTILDFRRRNSESVHLGEHLLSGKPYTGPKYNYYSSLMGQMGQDLISKELAGLYRMEERF